jgi:hypothetical protein
MEWQHGNELFPRSHQQQQTTHKFTNNASSVFFEQNSDENDEFRASDSAATRADDDGDATTKPQRSSAVSTGHPLPFGPSSSVSKLKFGGLGLRPVFTTSLIFLLLLHLFFCYCVGEVSSSERSVNSIQQFYS